MHEIFNFLDLPTKAVKPLFTPSSLKDVATPYLIKVAEELQEHGVIFTGSIALHHHGVLRPNRRIQDIDIVVQSTAEIAKLVSKIEYLEYVTKSGKNTKVYPNQLQLVQLRYADLIKIDCFIRPEVPETICIREGIGSLRDILKAKVDIIVDQSKEGSLVYKKHRLDLLHFLNAEDKPDRRQGILHGASMDIIEDFLSWLS